MQVEFQLATRFLLADQEFRVHGSRAGFGEKFSTLRLKIKLYPKKTWRAKGLTFGIEQFQVTPQRAFAVIDAKCGLKILGAAFFGYIFFMFDARQDLVVIIPFKSFLPDAQYLCTLGVGYFVK